MAEMSDGERLEKAVRAERERVVADERRRQDDQQAADKARADQLEIDNANTAQLLAHCKEQFADKLIGKSKSPLTIDHGFPVNALPVERDDGTEYVMLSAAGVMFAARAHNGKYELVGKGFGRKEYPFLRGLLDGLISNLAAVK